MWGKSRNDVGLLTKKDYDYFHLGVRRMPDAIENVLWIISAILSAEQLVWIVGTVMSSAAAYILHQFVDDWLYAAFAGLALFVAILIANFAFAHIGLIFTFDRQANVVAAAGAAVLAVTFVAVVSLRVWFGISDLTYRLRHKDESL
jgi:hypothetical protein